VAFLEIEIGTRIFAHACTRQGETQKNHARARDRGMERARESAIDGKRKCETEIREGAEREKLSLLCISLFDEFCLNV